jgi:hypothetical protein
MALVHLSWGSASGAIAKALGFSVRRPGYNADADLNDDSFINAQDLRMLNTQFRDPQASHSVSALCD